MMFIRFKRGSRVLIFNLGYEVGVEKVHSEWVVEEAVRRPNLRISNSPLRILHD